jgi:HEAT repeat protein
VTGPVFSRATPGEIHKRRLQEDAQGLAELFDTPEAKRSSTLRRDIAFALGRIDATPAFPVLRRLARSDPDETVRLHAIVVLAAAGDRQSIDVFESALKERNRNIRAHAVGGLERSGLPEAVRPLIAGLDDQNVSIRTSAARALARIGDPAALAPLERTLKRTWRPFARAYLKEQLSQLRKATGRA